MWEKEYFYSHLLDFIMLFDCVAKENTAIPLRILTAEMSLGYFQNNSKLIWTEMKNTQGSTQKRLFSTYWGKNK